MMIFSDAARVISMSITSCLSSSFKSFSSPLRRFCMHLSTFEGTSRQGTEYPSTPLVLSNLLLHWYRLP